MLDPLFKRSSLFALIVTSNNQFRRRRSRLSSYRTDGFKLLLRRPDRFYYLPPLPGLNRGPFLAVALRLSAPLARRPQALEKLLKLDLRRFTVLVVDQR
jgi:hypothetical protein